MAMYDNVTVMSLKKKRDKTRKEKEPRYIHPSYKCISSFVQVLELQIGHFPVVGFVPLSLSESVPKVELVLIQTSFLNF